MKTLFNLTTSTYDLERYASREHFLSTLRGFDGVELMVFEEDARGIVPREKVVGLHMRFPTCWLDFWNGDRARLRAEFGTEEKAFSVYVGAERGVLLQRVREDWHLAGRYGAEYMVFHATDCTAAECLRGEYAHSDEEVVDALCELLNAALPTDAAGPLLLLENLWEPGLRFTRPEITRRLLEGLRYPRIGLMLDTGHLMHTQPGLRTQREALDYINRRLDEHGELCRYIRGVHLHQSLTGAVMRRARRDARELPADYEARMERLFTYIFQMDRHRPFVCPGVRELIERVDPAYVTYEFISRDLPELQRMLRRQANAMKKEEP